MNTGLAVLRCVTPLPRMTSVFLGAAAIFSLSCASPAPLRSAPEPPQVSSSRLPLGPVDFRGRPLEAGYVAFRFTMVGGFGDVSGVLAERSVDGADVLVATAVGARRRHAGSREQWDSLVKEVETAGFWSMPEEDDSPYPHVKDGDAWVLEGLLDGRRHRVIRRNPRIRTEERRLSDFVALCRAMADVGQVKCGGAGCLPIDYLRTPIEK